MKTQNTLLLGAGKLVALMLALMAPSQITAQEKQNTRRVIEEVIVTAQKREEGIRDVPISMVALDDEFLAEKGITDFSELSNFVPNVKLRTDVGSGINLNIRGFSKQSGNPAFDQAVGLLVDGVSYNDNDYFVTGLVDLARIEVLRGPQGTLLGKNTTAGLINLTTKNPSPEFGGYVDLQSGDFDHERLEGAFGGPLIRDVLHFRIAGLSDKRDGVIDNTTARVQEDPRSFFPGVAEKQLNRDRTAFRVKLEAPDLFGSTWRIQYERGDVNAVGNGTEIIDIDADSEAYLRQFDPNLDVESGNYVVSENDPSFSDRVVEKTLLTWIGGFGEWGLEATAGNASVSGLVAGGDPTPAPLFGFFFDTDKPQSNLDIVLTSPPLWDGIFDLTAGLFYEERELDMDIGLLLNSEPILGIITADDDSNSLVLPSLPLPLGLDAAIQESSTLFFNQDTKTAALYGQLNWHFADQWKFTPGVRVSREKKQADIRRVFNSTNTTLLTSTLGYEEFDVSLSRAETTVQPKLSLNFKPNDDISLFVHWARGFRGGGFNAAAGRAEGLDYDKEVVDEYAITAKSLFLEGSLQLNLGIFRMELEDFQLLTSGPNDLSVVTVNAGRARTQGVESDLTWLATNWLAVNLSAAYNDATFTDFRFGPCPPDRPNFDGDNDPRCDLTGARLPFSPEWSGSLSLNLNLPFSAIPALADSLFGNLELLAGLNVEYQTESVTGLPGDSRYTQGEYARYGATIGVSNPVSGWTLRLTGKNLTDESVNRSVANIPTTNNFVQDLEPPQTFYLQFRWNHE